MPRGTYASSEYSSYNEQPHPIKENCLSCRSLQVCTSGLAVHEIHSPGKTTKQTLYICKKIQRLYFSKVAYIDIEILPKDLPNPVATISTQANIAKKYTSLIGIHQESNANSKPNKGGEQLQRCPKKLFSPNRIEH